VARAWVHRSSQQQPSTRDEEDKRDTVAANTHVLAVILARTTSEVVTRMPMCATKEEEEALDHGSTCEREGVEIRERAELS
jgi:hypothetical protein